eukprot:Gb_09657 [translate_table: standard]
MNCNLMTHPARAFIKDVKRVVIKVGTTIVTRPDGKLAIGRLGSLCEQVKDLMDEGVEVIVVTSGAVGMGQQRLRQQRVMNSSFVQLQKSQGELEGKLCAAAAVGQCGLMSLYEILFAQVHVATSQLLVKDQDFKDPDFCSQLYNTVNSLLDLKVVPILNENNAISAIKASFKDTTASFLDNDSLAHLLAMELKADLLILLCDVEGLYTQTPSDHHLKLIHTYIKEKHESHVIFGPKSQDGQSGLMAKISAACNAAASGLPAVIASGCTTDGIQRLMKGELVGTLFPKNAGPSKAGAAARPHDMAVLARNASRLLQDFPAQERKEILVNIANALEANIEIIKHENEADLRAAKQDGLSELLIEGLELKNDEILRLAKSVRILAEIEEPIGQILKATEAADALILEKATFPFGVLIVLFDSRPDIIVQTAALAIRNGNGLLLKGGSEASRSSKILHKVIVEVLPSTISRDLIRLISPQEETSDFLKLDNVIDLVIPSGSNQFVSTIKEETDIPVLSLLAADLEKAIRAAINSKADNPLPYMEKLLACDDLGSNGHLEKLLIV